MVKSSSLIDIKVLAYDECEERVRNLFDRALSVFLEGNYRSLPVKLGNGEKIDLFQLFVLVREKGGSNSVSSRGLWGLVAEELDLDRFVSPSLRLVYSKYLNRMEKWAKESSRIVNWENQDCKKKGCYGGLLHELGEGFKGLLENGTSQKRILDTVVGCSSSSEFYRSMKRSRDSSHCGKLEVSSVVVSDDPVGLDFSFKNKGDISKMLKWLNLVARSPKDPSQLKYYTGNAYWMQLVKGRKALAVERDYQSDIDGVTATIAYVNRGIIEPEESWDVIKRVPEGPKYQAQVEEWTGGFSSASDTKWLGTLIWPLKNEEGLDETVGKGRQESCNCVIPNAIECSRFHIAEKRMELKRELGTVFFQWRFNEMGEEVSLRWNVKEEKMFKEMIIADCLNFWEKAVKCFNGKKRQQLVSYFFNVFLINKRRYQNRVTARDINSDDEEDFGSVGRRFGSDAVTSSDTMICSLNRQSDEF